MTEPSGALRLVVPCLALTQMIGWGTTYYLPAILAPAIRAETGFSQETIFSGVTIMLIVGAFVAPVAGRRMERRGARGAMMLGSLLIAAALALLSVAHGILAWSVAWVLIGAAMPLCLTQAALTAVAQRSGPNARKAVSTLLLLMGFSSSVFWPFTSFLDSHLGWRAACLVLAGLHVVVCLPVHAAVLATRPVTGSLPGISPEAAPTPQRMPPEREVIALSLAALAFSLAGFVSWGLPLQAVEILTRFGHPLDTAVWIAALMGPAQVLARIGEVTLGQRTGILTVGLASSVLLPFAAALPLVTGHSVSAAVIFIVGYGMAAGAMTIVRSVLPLTLFGRERYARLLGQLALPQNLALACAPLAFAFTMSRSGPEGVLWLSVIVALLALAAMVGLAVTVGRR